MRKFPVVNPLSLEPKAVTNTTCSIEWVQEDTRVNGKALTETSGGMHRTVPNHLDRNYSNPPQHHHCRYKLLSLEPSFQDTDEKNIPRYLTKP